MINMNITCAARSVSVLEYASLNDNLARLSPLDALGRADADSRANFGEILSAARPRQPPAPSSPDPIDPLPRQGPRDPRTMAVDLFQMALDIIGMADPTPISDGINTVVSLLRRDWAGAAISALSMIPFWGDTFKTARLEGMANLLEDAIRLAINNPKHLPGFDRLKDVANSRLFTNLVDALGHALQNPAMPGPVRNACERIIRAVEQLRQL